MADSEINIKDRPHFTFIWTIGNVCQPCFIKSPIFTVKDMEMTQFVLYIAINSGDFIKLLLRRICSDFEPQTLEIKLELSFLGIDGFPIIKTVDTCDIIKHSEAVSEQFADKHEVLFRRRADFMPKDSLTVRCRMWRAGTEIAQNDMCFARTLLRQDPYFFVWAIKEFSTIQRHQTRKIILNTTALKVITLQLFLSEKDGEEYVGIALEYSDVDESECCIMKLSLLDFEGKTVHSEEKFEYCHVGIQLENFFQKKRLVDDKFSLIPNDVLSLRCEIQTEPEVVWNIIENYSYLHRMSSGVIATDKGEVLRFEQAEIYSQNSAFKKSMKDLLKKGTLSDVNLQTETTTFPAHKSILSARSPVFKAMFNVDMKEKTSKSVAISDVDDDTLGKLLCYIYTNTIRLFKWQAAINLFGAADKYELLNLKTICSTFLKSGLSADNVCAVLGVADMHHDQELREAAQEFLIHQGKEFFASDTWRTFKEENSVLALDVLERMHCSTRIQ